MELYVNGTKTEVSRVVNYPSPSEIGSLGAAFAGAKRPIDYLDHFPIRLDITGNNPRIKFKPRFTDAICGSFSDGRDLKLYVDDGKIERCSPLKKKLPKGITGNYRATQGGNPVVCLGIKGTRYGIISRVKIEYEEEFFLEVVLDN